MHYNDRDEPGRARVPVVIALLASALGAVQAFAATAPAPDPAAHYDIEARFDARSGYLRAAVDVTIPQAHLQPEMSFLLNERFKVNTTAFGRGVQVTVAPADRPIAGLQTVTVRFDQ